MPLPKNKKLPKKRFALEGRPVTHNSPSGPKGSGPKLESSIVKGGGKKPGQGGGRNGMPKNFGALGGFKGVPTRKVRRLVNGVLRDEIKDLRREKASVRRDTRHELQQSRRDYRRAKTDLNHVFGETGDYLNFLNNQNQETFQNEMGNSSAISAALQQQLGGTYSGAMDQVNAEMARLGIEGAANTSGMVGDQAFMQSLAAQSGANAQTNLGMANANSSQMMNLLSGMNQGSFMSALGQSLNSRNDQMTEIRRDRQDNFNAVRDAIRDVKGSRRDMFFQLLNQLQETGWSQYMDQQQLKLARKNSRQNS